jgi:hypothetical protein
VKTRLLLAAVLTSFLLSGCSDRGRPDEPAGKSVRFPPLATDFPEPMRIWAGWQREGQRAMVKGDPQAAIFCFHKAEEAFPTVRPEFPRGWDWAERSWSGRPFQTYLAKATVYAGVKELPAAEYYLQKARDCQEHPSDAIGLARAEANLAFAKEDNARVVELLGKSDDVFDLMLAAAARHRAGDKEAAADLRRFAREALSHPKLLEPRKAWLPRGVWNLAQEQLKGPAK